MDWFLYDIGLRHERVNPFLPNVSFDSPENIRKPWAYNIRAQIICIRFSVVLNVFLIYQNNFSLCFC